jgi:hypothetical protein
MKRFLTTIALACVLSGSVAAGEIPTSGTPAPAPSGMTQTITPTSPGGVPTGGSAEEMSEAALSALLTVLGFLTA